MKQFTVLFTVLSLSLAAPGSEKESLNLHPYPFHPTVGGRIVGGEVAHINEFPFIVAILRNGNQICGGSLVGPRTVLTAAHCVAPSVISQISQLSIRSGSRRHNTGGLHVPAKRIILHPQYRDCWWCEPDYDIAVIELAHDAIAPGVPAAVVHLWDERAHFADGTVSTVAGWGVTRENGQSSVQLLKVNVPIVRNDECRSAYGSIISSRTICAGYAHGGKDACQGDSGGPLVIGGRLAGVVSFGSGCARPGYPGVYASVPGYRQWIRQNAHV